MARARNIKPGFFKNERLAELNPLARILFAGLWCLADRKGRLEDRPKRIKAEVLPYDDCDINQLLNYLNDAKFILRYVVNNENYIQILTFHLHQNPHIREAVSTIPPPETALEKHSESTVLEQEEHGTSPADSLNPHPDSLNPIKDIVPYKEIIEYLNLKTGKNFRYNVESNKKWIKFRWNEGFRVEHFKTVVDNKSSQWLKTKDEKYLRPETLFGNKFEGYLNEKPPRKKGESYNDILFENSRGSPSEES